MDEELGPGPREYGRKVVAPADLDRVHGPVAVDERPQRRSRRALERPVTEGNHHPTSMTRDVRRAAGSPRQRLIAGLGESIHISHDDAVEIADRGKRGVMHVAG